MIGQWQEAKSLDVSVLNLYVDKLFIIHRQIEA